MACGSPRQRPIAHDAGPRPRAEVAGNGLTWAKSALAEAAGVSTGVVDGLVDAGTLITEELPAWAPPPLDLSTARARLTPSRRTPRPSSSPT